MTPKIKCGEVLRTYHHLHHEAEWPNRQVPAWIDEAIKKHFGGADLSPAGAVVEAHIMGECAAKLYNLLQTTNHLLMIVSHFLAAKQFADLETMKTQIDVLIDMMDEEA
jgi:hypothetical protein